MTRNEKIGKMHEIVFDWFAKNGRDLPWRKSTDPYAIVVSEIMLQQTQVERVRPLWEAFLERFPNWRALATSSQADVVRYWHGLGYNRRAMNLHRLAKAIAELGELPRDPSAMMQLPGIGPYTSNAVAAFAFRSPNAAPVDTNIERIFKRVFGVYTKDRRFIERLVFAARPVDTWTWNHALMDIGALHCTARNHDWAACPLAPLHGTKPKRDEDLKIPKQSKFEDSDRMYRGRIVSTLRGGDSDVDDLAILVGLADEERFGRILASLISDGIVREDRGILSLA